MTLEIKILSPFGIVVTSPKNTCFADLSAEQIHDWVREHRVLILRGFEPLGKYEMPATARRLGPLQPWSFGAVNELRAEPNAKNYLYTPNAVPLHWDGAFTKKAPRYLFFQCMEAPPRDAGGETYFVDTTKVFAHATEEQRSRWGRIKIRYHTEKIVHYGGTVTVGLTSEHPYTKQPTLRFAEPVYDKNPVIVEPLHMNPQEAAHLQDELSALLHQAQVTLVHSWQEGDIVLADNHALLHGRRSYLKDAPRYLLRVNIMGPERTFVDTLRDSMRIRRPEFMIAEVPIFFISLFLTLRNWHSLQINMLIVTGLLFFLLFHFGDMVNCLADRELDAVYKTHLSEAVYGLGLPQVRWQIGITAALAVGISLGLSIFLARPWILLIVLIGLGVGAQYSLPPLHLKGRGLWQILTLWSVIFFGPMLLVCCVFTLNPPPLILATCAAYGLLQEAIILINTAEDEPDDRASRIQTAVVRMGLKRSVMLSATLVAIGAIFLLSLLSLLIYTRGLPLITYVSLGPPLLASAWVFANIYRLACRVTKESPATILRLVRTDAKKMPLWITATAWTTCLTAVFIFWETLR